MSKLQTERNKHRHSNEEPYFVAENFENSFSSSDTESSNCTVTALEGYPLNEKEKHPTNTSTGILLLSKLPSLLSTRSNSRFWDAATQRDFYHSAFEKWRASYQKLFQHRIIAKSRLELPIEPSKSTIRRNFFFLVTAQFCSIVE